MEERQNDVKRVLSGFSPVWERVTGSGQKAPAAAPMPDEAPPKIPGGYPHTTVDLMQREARDAACLRRLYGRFGNRNASILKKHSQQAARRFRRLAAEHFVRSGERRSFPDSCRPKGSRLDALRLAMERDLEAAEHYRHAAADTDDPEMRQLYAAFERERRKEAAEKRSIIRRLF